MESFRCVLTFLLFAFVSFFFANCRASNKGANIDPPHNISETTAISTTNVTPIDTAGAANQAAKVVQKTKESVTSDRTETAEMASDDKPLATPTRIYL